MRNVRWSLGILLITVACQTKPKQEAQTAETSETTQNDSTLALTTRPKPGAPRSAADRLVRALYFEHNTKENPFREAKDRTLIDQFFAKPTADLIWNDAQKATGKVNRKKVNLLYNAPDASIKKTWVEPAAIGGSKSIVYVTFLNNNKPEEARIELNQIAGGRWRIADILYPNKKKLTELLN
ncbi:hypothetical protein [Spirosoma sp. KNUC1025]|uniref:hypothetical protein n=1 Tax=Spirosoma sp. KNUC1025 TaxID=2894082 RepID=UPI00386965BE|nr:hypothetical protein LN737_11570 [Spirosoma sp. KNUC1025]